MFEHIYLDHNATTPVLPEAIQQINTALLMGGNSSSVHSPGRQARKLIENAREHVAFLVGANPSHVIFTSGGTEANNLALRGVDVRVILASAVEHDSVLSGAETVLKVPVDANGIVEIEAIKSALIKNGHRSLISVMLANNETGVIQPVREIANIAHEFGALVHCDAVQGVGKIPCNMGELGVDLLSISGHKLGAPQGVGALLFKNGININPIIKGGGQETGNRSGTENLIGIVGFGAAAKFAVEHLDEYKEFGKLRDALEEKLGKFQFVKIFGHGVERIPNTSCFCMPGVSAEFQVMNFDLERYAVSSGSACSSGKVGVSHVLLAMGVEKNEAESAIRVSLGWGNKQADVDLFCDSWADILQSSQDKIGFQLAMAD